MLKTIFDFALGPLPQRVPWEGPDCKFIVGNLRFWVDPGPDPGGNNSLCFNVGPRHS